jgi:hypothetical protein
LALQNEDPIEAFVVSLEHLTSSQYSAKKDKGLIANNAGIKRAQENQNQNRKVNPS